MFSDSAAVCGRSAWRTALEVWLDKTGQLPDLPPSPQMEWGLRLEPAIAEAYSERTGLDLSSPSLCRHPQYPWMLASIDRLVSGPPKVVELKTASPFAAGEWGDPGTDEIPESYLIQVQHQLAVCGLQVADVALFG